MNECIVPNEKTPIYTYPIYSRGKYRGQIRMSTTIPDTEFFDIICDEYIDNLVAVEDKIRNIHMWFNPNYPINGILDLVSIELDKLESVSKSNYVTVSVVADSLLKPFFEQRGYQVTYKHNDMELYIMQLKL